MQKYVIVMFQFSFFPTKSINHMEFSDLNFNPKILQAITELGYQNPTPIQGLAIPKVIEGTDLIASAQTGTGKTAAFILPALQKISMMPKTKKGTPRLLVLVPTRELAMQVALEARKFSKYLNDIKTVCIYGGQPIRFQEKMLFGRLDILIATPGRLLDFMERGRIDLSQLSMLVLDEADRMLDMGFIDAVKEIASQTPQTRQTLLFSATFDTTILNLSKDLQNNPFQIEVKKDPQTLNNIEQRLYFADGLDHKQAILDHLLSEVGQNTVIIFTSTKIFADELTDKLKEKDLKAQALHGDMNQRQRTRALDLFKSQKANILVATDVAARGIDVSKLSYVINFDLPNQLEDYVHRIGRTGRAGEKGVAISLALHKERFLVSKIEEKFKQPMNVLEIEGLEPKKPLVSQDRKQRRGFHSRSSQSKFSRNDSSKFKDRNSSKFKEKSNFKFKKSASSAKPRVA
jgi:superfamily II DNA/RNA helicase